MLYVSSFSTSNMQAFNSYYYSQYKLFCNIQSLDKIPICKKNKRKYIHHIRQHLKCLSTFLECGFIKIAFILKCQNLSKTFSMTIDISLEIRKVAFM